MKKEIETLAEKLIKDFKHSIVALDVLIGKIDLSQCLCMYISGAMEVMKQGGCSEEEMLFIKDRILNDIKKQSDKAEAEVKKKAEEKISLNFNKD